MTQLRPPESGPQPDPLATVPLGEPDVPPGRGGVPWAALAHAPTARSRPRAPATEARRIATKLRKGRMTRMTTRPGTGVSIGTGILAPAIARRTSPPIPLPDRRAARSACGPTPPA